MYFKGLKYIMDEKCEEFMMRFNIWDGFNYY